jgi:HD-like signal output (HDOD) protein/ActR/RegA family two-component response regulator
MKRILFVDDEQQVLEGLRDALRACRREWKMTFVSGGEEALAVLAEQPHDVVVSDMRMPGMDGAALLSEVQQRHPDTVRIVLSGYAEAESLVRVAAVAHRFLAKPCDVQELRHVVERSCALSELAHREGLRRAASGAVDLPLVPRVYRELTVMLEDPGASIEDVAALVECDPAITAKVLQLANSAFFSLKRHVTKVRDAVAYVGLGTVKALVLSAGAFAALPPARPIPHLVLDELERHGLATGRLAGQIVDGEGSDVAVAGGLLRDIGLLVLASQEPEYLEELLRIAHDEGRPLVEVEMERGGTTHAEIGAHLLALWGLPHEIVECVAYHHTAPGGEPRLDAAAAVHISEALLAEQRTGAPLVQAPGLDPEYVERLGVADRLPGWSQLAAEGAAVPA